MKYKVGDVVKTLSNPWCYSGLVCIITSVDSRTCLYQLKLPDGNTWWLRPVSFILEEPYLDKKEQ